MVEENDRIHSKISEISPSELFSPLMEPHIEKVDEVISPGLTLLRWTSLNIDSYLKSVEESLKELELLVERVCNTYEFQIQGVLSEIQSMELCALPDSEPWTVDEFVNSTQVGEPTRAMCTQLATLFSFWRHTCIHLNYRDH